MEDNYLINLLRNRRSIRRFKAQEIEQEKIDLLKKAVLMSPSGKRINEWEFIFVTDKQTLKALAQCKDAGSQLIEGAALAIAVAVDKAKTDITIEDASIASTILQLEAQDLGLGSCWVQCRLRSQKDGTAASDNVKKILNIPDSLDVENIIAIGYKDEERKPYDDTKLPYNKIHSEKW